MYCATLRQYGKGRVFVCGCGIEWPEREAVISWLYDTKKFYNLFQDGGTGNAWNGQPPSAENARRDNGASTILVNVPGTNTAISSAIVTNPIYYIRGSYIDENTQVRAVGALATIRAATIVHDKNAFYLHFDSARLYPSHINGRYFGTPLRCLHSQ